MLWHPSTMRHFSMSTATVVSSACRRTRPYAERDHGGGRFLDLEVRPLGSAAALASLTWEQFKANGSVYRRFRRSYNLLRIDTDWKIVVATAHRD